MGQSLAIKIISYLFFALFAVSIVLAVVFAFNMNEEVLIGWAYVLAIVAIGATLLFGLINMFSSKKAIITSLGVLAAFGVLVGISYGIASGIVPSDSAGEVFDITEGTSRWSGTSLYLLYILLGISFLSLVYTEIRGAFK